MAVGEIAVADGTATLGVVAVEHGLRFSSDGGIGGIGEERAQGGGEAGGGHARRVALTDQNDYARGFDPADLTSRQREVLALLADGLSNSEIAARLCITTSTVEMHVSNIYIELGLWRIDKSVLRVRAALAYHDAVERED